MKKTIKHILLLVALAVTAVTNLSAQISKNIVDTTKVWYDGLIYPGGISTFTFQFGKDTIYNNQTYKQLISYSYYYDPISNFLFREDSNRVYFVHLGDNPWDPPLPNNQEEYLLYDFNLEVGDTVTICGLISTAWLANISYKVESTDTVIIHDTPLKHLVLTAEHDVKMEWIEGIGCMSGLLHREVIIADGPTPELFCFSQDGEVIYQSSTAERYKECFIEVALDEINNYNINIFPNPTENRVCITIPRPMSVIVSNTEGRELFRKNLNTKDTLDLTNLKSGVYILTFSDGIKTFSKTFIKE
ncbi:MAG: T9SS type A sorting domain-containing protein [Bacteroidales bacterium]|nr:T9SS type A sorting domain-containing protein [Bacteroidales bacterium]